MNVFIGPRQKSAGMVRLEQTHQDHLIGKKGPDPAKEAGKDTFGGMLIDALSSANQVTQDSTSISQQFLVDPNSVDVHDVTIAMGKANLAVSMTKSVVDNVLKAYREIMNLR